MTDSEIIQAIKTPNSRKALEFLYKTQLPKIKKMVRSNSGSEEDALDVFQEALLKFYNAVLNDKFKEGFEIGGFLFVIARNEWINLCNKRSKQAIESETYLSEIDTNSPLKQLEAAERSQIIESVFSKLGEKCRELMHLVGYYKLTMKGIAIKLNLLNEDVAKTRHYKCKKRLIEILEKDPFASKYLRHE